MATAAATKYPGPKLVQRRGGEGNKMVTGADIQIENGEYFKIHNRIVDALYSSDFNGLELRLLLYIFRRTYGWQCKETEISYNEFAAATNSSRRVVIRYLNGLLEKNVIRCRDNGAYDVKTWWFNKYIEEWTTEKPSQLASDQLVTSDQTVTNPSDQLVTISSDQLVTPPSDQLVTQYKDNTKDIKTGESAQKNSYVPTQEHTKHLATMTALNAELPAKQRVPYIDPIANYMGVKSLIDNGDDEWLVKIHNLAVWAHSMGIQVSDFRAWWKKWKTDFRSDGPTEKQFKHFCSQRMDERKTQPVMQAQPMTVGKILDNPFSL